MMFSRNTKNSNNSNMQSAGMAVLAAGVLVNLISSGIAAATTPQADIRAWEGLPGQVYLQTLDSPPSDPGVLSMSVNSASAPVPFAVTARNGACGFVWAHFPVSKQLMPQTQIIPEDTDDRRGPENMAFRERLKTQF